MADKFETASEFFKTLGDPTRIRIFWHLCHAEECVSGLSEMLGVSCPAVSQHLQRLRECGLVGSRRVGKEVYYSISDDVTSLTLHTMVEQIMEITCPADEAGATSRETARKAHDYLVEHLSERVTIEELSKLFHINATTLKQAFKAEYGMSLAAHTKEHRLERAAALLRESENSIADIAASVGYDSASRFTTAFFEKYGVKPSEYRKNCC